MSVISEVEQQVRKRLKELEPLVAEYEQLIEVAATFERASGSQPSGGRRAERAAKPRAARRRGGTPGRAEQALELINAQPGITVAGIAEQLEIGTTYLYRLLPALENDGQIQKVGKGYEPAGKTSQPAE